MFIFFLLFVVLNETCFCPWCIASDLDCILYKSTINNRLMLCSFLFTYSVPLWLLKILQALARPQAAQTRWVVPCTRTRSALIAPRRELGIVFQWYRGRSSVSSSVSQCLDCSPQFSFACKHLTYDMVFSYHTQLAIPASALQPSFVRPISDPPPFKSYIFPHVY